MKKTLMALTVVSLLTACVPGGVVAGAASGSVFADQRNIGTQWQDKKISHKIGYWVNNNPAYHLRTHVNVDTINGVVLLTGQTATEQMQQEILDYTHEVPGVKRAYNRMSIQNPSSISERAKDSWLTTKIKSSILTQANFNSSTIKVITEERIAYLMGIVTREQGDQVADITRHVPGVRKVVKLFEYMG